jgi:hypothetical protein
MPWFHEFSAVKDADGLVVQGRDFYERAIAELGDGEQVVLTLSKPSEKRSSRQNRFLWGPLYDELIQGLKNKRDIDRYDAIGAAMADDQGIDAGDVPSKEQMHEGLLQLFAGTVIDPLTKREVAKERSSTMSTARFTEFVEFIARYAATEHQIVVTLPGEL